MKLMCDCHDQAHYDGCTMGTDRRRFLKLATLTAGVALYASAYPFRAQAGGGTEALLLNCMDYRLADDVTKFMDSLHLTNGYDQLALAGASLAALTDKFPEWNKTFWDHLKVAIDLHHIKKVIVIDHRDCGAYRVVYGKDFGKDPAAETAIHAEHLQKLAAKIKEFNSHLGVDLYLMALDGTVEGVKV